MYLSRSRYYLLFFVFTLIFLRLWLISWLPAETYGDVNEHLLFLDQARNGQFSLIHWWGGDGPLFTLFVLPLTYLVGVNFFVLKLGTVLISVLTCILLISYANHLGGLRLAWWSGVFFTISSWSILQSLTGKPHSLVMLWVMLALLSMQRNWKIGLGLVLVFGFLTQTSFWAVLALAFFSWQSFIIVVLVLGIWLCLLGGFQTAIINGYLLSKTTNFTTTLFGDGENSWLMKIMIITMSWLEQQYNSLLALFWRGDSGFRHYPSLAPHLDWSMFLLVLLGLFWLYHKSRAEFWKVSLILWLAQLLSTLELGSQTTANVGRTAGMIPLLSLLAGVGITSIENYLQFRPSLKWLAVVMLVLVTGFNSVYRVKQFVMGLPLANLAISQQIVGQLQELSITQDITVSGVLSAGCCWLQYGHPEPKSLVRLLPAGWQFASQPIDNLMATNLCNQPIIDQDSGQLVAVKSGWYWLLIPNDDFKSNFQLLREYWQDCTTNWQEFSLLTYQNHNLFWLPWSNQSQAEVISLGRAWLFQLQRGN